MQVKGTKSLRSLRKEGTKSPFRSLRMEGTKVDLVPLACEDGYWITHPTETLFVIGKCVCFFAVFFGLGPN